MEQKDRTMLPFTEEDRLSPTGERIVADRYLLKDAKKESLKPGSLVVAVVDKKRAYHELGKVVTVDPSRRTAVVELRDGHRIEQSYDDLDVLKEQSPREMWRRIAKGAAAVTKDPALWEERFYQLQSGWKYVPGGRINASMGTGFQTTSYNCFVIPSVGPRLRDYAKSFGQTLEIQARSGGVGMNLSRIPPRGSLIPVSKGPRRSQLQLVLDVWHPDLFDFLQEAYPHSTKVVRVNRAFLQAVEDRADWTFVFPDSSFEGYDDLWDGDLAKWMKQDLPVKYGTTVPALTVYDKILESGVVMTEEVLGTVLVPGDSRGTIAETLGDMWEEMARGRRTAVILSSLRPRYTYVKGVNGRSSGAYSWGILYDKGNQVFGDGFGPVGVGEIMSVGCQLTLQGGSRRGALMLILNDRHADLHRFIQAKQVEGVITGANVSVGISEEFMQVKQRGGDWSLGFPRMEEMDEFDGDFGRWEAAGRELVVTETLPAEELWEEIITSAWKSAEPGVVFLGRYNAMSNSWYYNPIIATNPCFHPDTRVATEFGYLRIEDLYHRVGSAPFQVLTDDRVHRRVEVVNGRSYAVPGVTSRPAVVFPTGRKRTVKVALKNGMELKVTPDHRLLTTDGWKEAGELQPGDLVLIQSGEGLFPEKDGLGRDWGWFLGWLVGDGWIAKRGEVGMVFGREDAEVIPEMIRIGKELSGAEAKVYERENGVFQVFWWRKEFRDRLLSLGVKQVRAEDKRVPEAVFEASRETVRAFLQALFSSDGTVYENDEHHRTVRMTSASKSLLQDVQLLLLNFGIHGKIYDRPKRNQAKFQYQTISGESRVYESNGFYELILSGNNVAVFAEKIGFALVTRKQEALQRISRPSRKREKFYSAVAGVEPGEEVTVYDVSEPETHSLVASGIVAHNCGEQGLPAFGICNLGAVVLSKFTTGFEDSGVEATFSDPAKEEYIRGWLRKHFDDERAEFFLHHIRWEALEETVRTGVRFQDAVIDATYYPFEENRENQLGERRVGLGIMGLHDLLIHCGVRYGSEESTRLIDVLMGMMAEWSYLESVELAKENGPFPRFETEKFLQSGYMRHMAAERPHVVEAIRKYGVRNVTTMTIAPTGTTGTMVGCSTGCEPYYAWSYFRNSRLGMFEENAQIVDDYLALHPGADREHLPDYFVTAMELTPEEHVRVQAALQKWIDSSISKTCNAPESYTVEDTKQLYDLAYDLGCKGVTIYRDGSRSEQVLALSEDKLKKEGAGVGEGAQTGTAAVEAGAAAPQAAVAAESPGTGRPSTTKYVKRKRPDVLYGATYKKETPLGTAYITINDDPEDHLAREIFVNIGKAGSDVYAANEALGRAITLYLMDSQNPDKEAVLVRHFSGIGGYSAVGFGERRITSVPDAIAKSLIEHSETFPLRHGGVYHAAASQGDPDTGRGADAEDASEDGHGRGTGGGHGDHGHGNGNGRSLRGFNIGKDLCPNCHRMSLVRQGGCFECEACGYSKC
ncbi:MAG: ribonucleoside-diphosphate reductase [Kyrpidia tusciae]|nr:LAGLIDADG family homing endonuclease [Kyrpidia tusciae]MBE3553238.1 ribonucleoside-diphosphate reductase [Kyrpidia tusciae]